MFKSCFQIAGEALAIAALSASAAAQNPEPPINTLTDLLLLEPLRGFYELKQQDANARRWRTILAASNYRS